MPFDRFLPYITGGLAVGDIRTAALGVGSGSIVNAAMLATVN